MNKNFRFRCSLTVREMAALAPALSVYTEEENISPPAN